MRVEADHITGAVTVHADTPCPEVVIGDGTKRNALHGWGWTELRRTVEALAEDSSVPAIVLRGAGGTFCAGSDLTEWVDADIDTVEDSFARMEAAFTAVERCPVPVLAEISGVAAGAGCQLALACDLRLMSENARIGMPIARLGINAGTAFAARMSVLIGPARTRRMLYTGRLLDGKEAEDCGLADVAAPEDELAAHTADMLEAITAQPPTAIRAAKHAVATTLPHQYGHDCPEARRAVDPATFTTAIAGLLGH